MFATPVARAEVCATLTKHQRGASSGPFRGSVVDRPARGLWGRRPDPREARRSDGVAQWCRQFVRSVCVAQFPRLLYHQTTCAEVNVVHLAGPRQSASRAAGPDQARHRFDGVARPSATGWRLCATVCHLWALEESSRRPRSSLPFVENTTPRRDPLLATRPGAVAAAPSRRRTNARDGPHPHVISEARKLASANPRLCPIRGRNACTHLEPGRDAQR